jgi:hypothetical protein
VACELPAKHDRPLGRFSRTELHRLVIEQGVTDASASTIWRWLHDRSLKPWQQRSWIFPRDRHFQPKAGRVLDLYARRFEGRRLHPGEYVICADEKSQLQALARSHQTVAPAPGRPALVEFEYKRGGTLAYLAAWDVHHARIFGRCEPKTGIEPFGRLVEQVMSTEPYTSAKTVFWVVDNGSSHAGKTSIARMQDAYPNARLIHLPIHASWLNQIEIYFSILQRKALTPNDFADLDALAARIMAFEQHYRQIANSTPAGVLATPARTATDWITLAHNNCREPLAKSISATAANRRPHLPASRNAITARASRARSNGVSSSSSTSSSTASPASSSSSAIASHNRPRVGESSLGSSTCNDRSRHGRSTSSPSSLANSRSLNAPADPATARAAVRKNPTAKLSSDGPRAFPQQRLTFRPLPHEHNSLRPTFAIGASSRQHRSEPVVLPQRTSGRVH